MTQDSVSDELVEMARRAYLDAPAGVDEMRAALDAIAPRLRAQGMREAVDMARRGWTIEYILDQADALDPPVKP